MKVHEIKDWPEYFQQTLDGQKWFEIHKNDRDYQVGDAVRLREYSVETLTYTGREMDLRITSVTGYGQKEGYIVFGTEKSK